MSNFAQATVTGVEKWGSGVLRVDLDMEDGTSAVGMLLESLVGGAVPGDLVIANTTAVDLGLGSGGFHFILWNLSAHAVRTGGSGHMMKLRYTPLQFNFEAAEEQLSAADLEGPDGPLEGMPVLAGSVHSQLLAAAIAYKDAAPEGRLSYVMTDGGALPAGFSRTVSFMREHGLLDSVITAGNAFGGEREAVTVHGALVAAKKLDGADAVIAVMGPGIAGTGSPVGFSGMEQGIVANASFALGGRPVIIPRITFADERQRHRGVSHHTLSVLKYGVCVRTFLPLPVMQEDRAGLVRRQLEAADVYFNHEVCEVDASRALALVDSCGIKATVMGRGTADEPEFFMAAAAAGMFAAGTGGGP